MMKRPLFAYLCIALLLLAGCSLPTGHPASTDPLEISLPVAAGDDVTAAAPAASTNLQGSADDTAAGDGGDDDDDGDNTDDQPLDVALASVESAQQFWAAGDRDHAIEALDRAYAALLKVPDDGIDKEQQQQKEDLRFLISKRLTEIYATRYTTTNGTHKEIPLTMNEHVEQEIKLFQTLERDFFLESYQRSGRYRDAIVKAFHDAGLPEDLSWLPLIESGFKVRALSRARALGLWQFIPSTGYKYGLKRTDWVDERLDPEKSTAAAIAYLNELHQMFGDWATVLAAYNCGEGAVLRAIRTQKIDYLDNFWDLYERLPRETARYYPRFLAVLSILKDPAKYGFNLADPDKPLSYETTTVDKPVQLKKLAEKLGCDSDDLADLNPELRYQATPAGSYCLRVPAGKAAVVAAALDVLPKYAPPKPAYVVHRVRRGETLSTIAMRYRTSIRRIKDANNLRSGRLIRIGQKLKIPLTKAS